MSMQRAINARRLERLASGGDHRSDEEKVFAAAALLADEIDRVKNAESRMVFWGEILTGVTLRARADWTRTVGLEPPLEGPTA